MTRGSYPTETTSPSPDHVLEVRADVTAPPELCGFYERTLSITCSPGQTCQFNTDLYAVGCCSNDVCDWRTSCCDYNPISATSFGTYTPTCGGLVPDLIGYCSDYPFCATRRWENGFTGYICTRNPTALVDSLFFTSAGEATARLGLPRLTGSNGPGNVSTQGSAVTVRVTETATVDDNGPSPGVIAGSVVGGAAFGAIVTLLAVFLTWYLRKKAASKVMAQNTALGAVSPGVHTNGNTQSPYETGWDASGRHELQVSRERGQERQELAAKPN